MTAQDIEFGLDSFVAVSVDEAGSELSGDVVIRNTIEEAVLADAVGIDSFNIAEHYRPDMMDSAGHVMLAAIAGRTQRIRLGTAVTVLSTQDPVRVYTNFATLDAAHPRSRFADGVVSTVRIRSRRLRRTLRGEARSVHALAAGPTRYLVRHLPLSTHRPVRQSSAPRGGAGGGPPGDGPPEPDAGG